MNDLFGWDFLIAFNTAFLSLVSAFLILFYTTKSLFVSSVTEMTPTFPLRSYVSPTNLELD